MEDYKELAARYLADYQNLQKNVKRNEELLTAKVKSDVLEDFIALNDDMYIASRKNELLNIFKQKLEAILTKNGVISEDVIGTDFDSDKHDAIHSIESEQKGKVIDAIGMLYTSNNIIIKKPKVIVGI